MTRVNARELEAIRKAYPTVEIQRTRHNHYIVGAREDELRAYMKVAVGQLSNRQKKDLYRNERRRLQGREQTRH